MELEAHARPRLDVAHAGQLQRRDDLSIAKTLPNPGRHFLQQPISRRILQQLNERFNLRPETYDIRLKLRVSSRNRWQLGEESEVSQTKQRSP